MSVKTQLSGLSPSKEGLALSAPRMYRKVHKVIHDCFINIVLCATEIILAILVSEGVIFSPFDVNIEGSALLFNTGSWSVPLECGDKKHYYTFFFLTSS